MKRLIVIVLLLGFALSYTFSQNQGNELIEIAKEFEGKNDFQKAIDYYTKALSWYKQNNQEEKDKFALCLHCIGRNYTNLNNTTKGREYTQQALELRRDLYGEINEDYISSLNNIALSYFIEEDYLQAVKLQEKVCELMKMLPKEHSNYGMYMMNMGRFYYFGGNRSAAAAAWEIALTKYEKFGDIYEKLLSWLGMIYEESKDSYNMQRIMALTEEHNEHELSKPCNEPECMLERAEYYSAHRIINKAQESYVQIFKMEMSGLMKSKAEESYAKFLFNMLNDYAGAADYYTLAAESYYNNEGEKDKYFQLLYNASLFEFLARNASACIEKAEKVRAFYSKQDNSSAQRELAKVHKTLGNAYKLNQDYQSCLSYYLKVLDYNLLVDKNSKETANILSDIAFVQRRLKQYDAAIDADERALSIYKLINDEDKYNQVYNDLLLCYTLAGKTQTDRSDEDIQTPNGTSKLDEIIESTLFQLPLMKEYMSSFDYAASLGTLAGTYLLKYDYKKALEYYSQYLDNLYTGVREQFRILDYKDRINIWNEIRKDLNELSELSFKYPVEDPIGINHINELLYDSQLLSKGILLNSSIEFSRVLKESNNKVLLSLYDDVKVKQLKLNELRNASVTNNDLQTILDLQQEITKDQIKLYDGCFEFADYTEYISFRWKDVKNKLTIKDVAIEFVVLASAEDILQDDKTMFALIIDANSTYPEEIAIGKIGQLKNILSDYNCFTDSKSGSAIWGKLSKYLEGKKRIFFSADALFNNIAIEYLPVDGKNISEQYDIYRLSSTKELCNNHRARDFENVVMIGAIDYGQMSESITTQHMQQLKAMRGMRESLNGFEELPFTEMEINQISSLYNNPLVLKKQEASELAFRELNNKKINLLHVSTHGSYLGHDKTTDLESMDLSLLVLSGANIGSEDIENDGIISAADISSLNLRECELVVLSACQTGLGHQGEDGVFGLQRGFKNAGVHTLLVTLSSVYDETTAILMEQFHKELASNPRNKRIALVKAQNYLREHGYDAPQYWVPFILLDAI